MTDVTASIVNLLSKPTSAAVQMLNIDIASSAIIATLEEREATRVYLLKLSWLAQEQIRPLLIANTDNRSLTFTPIKLLDFVGIARGTGGSWYGERQNGKIHTISGYWDMLLVAVAFGVPAAAEFENYTQKELAIRTERGARAKAAVDAAIDNGEINDLDQAEAWLKNYAAQR